MNFDTAHAEPKQTTPQVQPPELPDRRSDPVRVGRSLPERQSRWWIWAAAVAVAALAVLGYFVIYPRIVQAHDGTNPAGGPGGGAANRNVPVVAVAAHTGDMNVFLNGLGTVTPLNTVSLHSRVDGAIVKVAFQEGQTVHHDTTQDDKQISDLDKGEQDKSDLLIQLDPRPYQTQLEQAQGSLARDQALLANANLDLTRITGLAAKTFATQQQLDTQKALVAQAEGTIKIDQAAIDNARLQLVYCNIRTPITGRVGLRYVDVGNIVHATDTMPLAIVTQLQPITVIFTIPQDDIAQVTRATAKGLGLRVDAYNRDSTKKIATGKLMAVDNQVDTGSGTVRLKAQFENADNELFASQFVNARLLVDTLKGAVIVPAAAVQRSPDATFVYVVKSDQTVEMRTIVVTPTDANETVVESGRSPSDGEQSSIEKGLATGEIVVTDGVDKLQAGSKVTVRAAAGRGKKGTSAGTQPTSRASTQRSGGDHPSTMTGTPTDSTALTGRRNRSADTKVSE